MNFISIFNFLLNSQSNIVLEMSRLSSVLVVSDYVQLSFQEKFSNPFKKILFFYNILFSAR